MANPTAPTKSGLALDFQGPIKCTGVVVDGRLIGNQAVVVAAITDNSGGATADGTIGAVTAPSALTDNSGGAAADGTIGVVTAPTALTHAVGTADNTVEDVTGAFDRTVLNNNFKELTTAQTANRTAIIALTDAIKEITTAQAANRLAIIALTDAVKEITTKEAAILTSLKNAGIMADA